MRRRITVAVLALSVLALVAGAPSNGTTTIRSWADRNGCDKQVPSAVSYKRTTALLKNHRPLTSVTKRKVRRYVECVATRAKARAVQRHVLRLRRWRLSYAHRWPIVFNRLPAWARAWAWNTGACESGNNPATNTGNGFSGAFQFVQSTWIAAGGTGVPHQHSWHYQAVIAVRWLLRTSDEQWPVCGD